MSGARPARAAALIAAALALGACGEDRSEFTSTETTAAPMPAAQHGQPPAPAEPPPAKVTVRESEYRIDPARIRVDRPATLEIKVRNTGAERHALDIEDGATGARTRTLGPGESQILRVDLDKPGRYIWRCPVGDHAKRGMRGSIAVARGGG